MPGDVLGLPEKGRMPSDALDDSGLFREEQLRPVPSDRHRFEVSRFAFGALDAVRFFGVAWR
jgi:hypothetical protein